ncbi:alpha-amylase [Vibrio sp. S9_S30]|uniref:alpha-amylase family protein n=1 Tax=Vibrio sp. S9_S30 TaxID=2720226 RepID=UPI00167FF377|nr:alpha-amylase family protein [Vibrio sp. S9_S30]MBD1557103.1 alpha-amylase [Vibrio sp. S9_S30]
MLQNEGRSNVILHAFDWQYCEVAEQAEKISRLGYRSVLVSPPLKSLKEGKGRFWWQRYQPQDYRIIDNPLGNTHDFKHMMQVLIEYDIWVYVDVVFNHMANESDRRSDLQYPAQSDMEIYKSNASYYEGLKLFGDLSHPLFDQDDFVEPFGIVDWCNKWEVQNGRISSGPSDPGLPTLKDNQHVIEQQRHYLKALKQLGVRGFRIDAAKHMSLQHLEKVWGPDITEGMHIFGEIITDGGVTKQEYELFLKPYLEKTDLAAYDFPLFNTLFKAMKPEGTLESLVDPYALGMALSNPRAVTFAITHDIPNNDVFKELVMDEASEWLAYAYLLGRDGGVPLIYAEPPARVMANQDRANRWEYGWQSDKLKDLLTFHHKMYGEKMTFDFISKDVILFSRGKKGIIGINKGKYPQLISKLYPNYRNIFIGSKCSLDQLEIKPKDYLIHCFD